MLEVELRRRLDAFELRMRLEVGRETLALFGPSGAGKSIFLKLIAGIERSDAGRIVLGGRLLFNADAGINLPPQRRKIGYVPQQYALFPHLTALENVEFPLRRGVRRLSSHDAARARELLDSFGLGERGNARPGALSGGQQQRVALARALASDPELLLLDEPFAALDTPMRVGLRQELHALQSRLNLPAIFVTHDLDEAAAVAIRMAVLIAGEVRQTGSVREIIERPVDLQVAELVQSRNALPGTVRRSVRESRVELPFGEFPVGASNFPDGTSVRAIIRPESFGVMSDDRAESSILGLIELTGTVAELRDEAFRSFVRVSLRGTLVDVSVSDHAGLAPRPRAGDPIRLVLRPDRIHLIPEPVAQSAG